MAHKFVSRRARSLGCLRIEPCYYAENDRAGGNCAYGDEEAPEEEAEAIDITDAVELVEEEVAVAGEIDAESEAAPAQESVAAAPNVIVDDRDGVITQAVEIVKPSAVAAAKRVCIPIRSLCWPRFLPILPASWQTWKRMTAAIGARNPGPV